MKITKISVFSMLLLMGTVFHTHCMDIEPSASAFKNLPLELKKEIFLAIASAPEAYSIDHALKIMTLTASSLGMHKELNELLNNKDFDLRLIKTLSARFGSSNMTVLDELNQRFSKLEPAFGGYSHKMPMSIPSVTLGKLKANQQSLSYLCQGKHQAKSLNDLYQEKVDLEFTEGYSLFEKLFVFNPLQIALVNLNKPVVESLIAHGANVNSQGTNELSPLLICEILYWDKSLDKNEIKELIQILLNAGADPELAETDGTTPLKIAHQTGDPDLILLIDDAIAKKYGKK